MVATIVILPNEILSSILSLFSTTALLPLTLTSRCFYNIIVQILQTRLFNASILSGHKIILECFHPSAKVFTPYLFVDNLGTGSCDHIESESRMLSKSVDTDRLGKLKSFYSHFRPLLPDEIHMSRRRRASSWGFDQSNSLTEIQSEYVCQNVHLESHELFSQLCTLTNMVREGQKPGIFLSSVAISGGVIRVWRDWLAERYASSGKFSTLYSRHNTMDKEEESRKCLLWADPRENVGIRIRVMKREDVESPILAGPDDEASVSYTLQYEELVIRTTQLLLMLERSNDQVGSTARGVIIGPWS